MTRAKPSQRHLQEVDDVLVSADRPFIPEASFVIEVDATLASASLRVACRSSTTSLTSISFMCWR